MRVLVLYNEPVLPANHPEYDSEEWVRTAVDDVMRHLASRGHQVIRAGVGRELRSLARSIAKCRPDVVFNLFEGHADRPETEIVAVRMMERLQIPFTGSGSRTLWRSLNKHLAKHHLNKAGLSVPPWRVFKHLPVENVDLPWPVIVKPARRDSSEGIDQASVVTSSHELVVQAAYRLASYRGPVLVEQFLPGREFTVALIEAPGLMPLPISEIDYRAAPAGRWPLLTYAAKWQPGTADYEMSDVIKAVSLPSDLLTQLQTLATSAFRVLGCRDYARVDLRMNQAGEPMILEVNANPDMSPSACFAKALEVAGIDRADFLARLVTQAGARRCLQAVGTHA